MAVSLLAREVSDLCLGKPALRSLSVKATIADALSVLKNSDDNNNFLSIWSCSVHHTTTTTTNTTKSSGGRGDNSNNQDNNCDDGGQCKCVGKVCMVDVICYLCKDGNLLSPSDALKAPVSVLLPMVPGLVMHLEPSSSLLEAIDLILQGAQGLVVPMKTSRFRRRQHQKQLSSAAAAAGGIGHTTTVHNGREFCWITQEDIIRFLLSSIGLFSPLPGLSIDTLGIIRSEVFTVDYHSPASSALTAISHSLEDQTSVAVTDGDGILIGELSPFTLACCDETVAAAISTLSCGDLMAYIDCGGPPENLVRVVMARLKKKGLEAMLQEFTNSTWDTNPCSLLFSSSDEESGGGTRVTTLRRSYSRSMSYSARMARRAEAIVCHPKSSLVAVMIQAIAHRVTYVWVAEDDCSLVGIVTFSDMLRAFREHLEAMS